MANFPAEISLSVDNSKALQQIGQVERALQKIQNTKLSPFERGKIAKAEDEINKQLDVQIQKYAAIDRLQRQLLANDDSRIKANRKFDANTFILKKTQRTAMGFWLMRAYTNKILIELVIDGEPEVFFDLLRGKYNHELQPDIDLLSPQLEEPDIKCAAPRCREERASSSDPSVRERC